MLARYDRESNPLVREHDESRGRLRTAGEVLSQLLSWLRSNGSSVEQLSTFDGISN